MKQESQRVFNLFKIYMYHTESEKVIIKICSILEYIRERWKSLWVSSKIDREMEESKKDLPLARGFTLGIYL